MPNESKNSKAINFGVVVVALLFGFLYYFPNLISYFGFKDNPDLAYSASASNLDEGFAYGTRIREVLDGEWWEGDPYLAEYKKMPNLWETNFAAIFFGGILRILGINSIDIIFSFGDFIFPAILFLTVFYLIFQIIKNRLFSMLGATIVLAFPNLFVLQRIFNPAFYGSFKNNFFSLIGDGFNSSLSRLFVPGFYIIFLFLFLIFCHRLATRDGKKDVWGCGILLGILFYLYLYYWIFACAVIGYLILWNLLARERKTALLFLKAMVLGLTISIPFWIKMLYLKSFALYGEYAARAGKDIIHGIYWQSRNLYILLAVLAIFFIFYGRKNKTRRPEIIFSFALMASMVSVLNMQILTGFNVQIDHWGSRVNVFITALLFFLALYFILEPQIQKKIFIKKYLPGIFILALFTFGFIMQYAETKKQGSDIALNRDVYEASIWINKNTNPGEVFVSPSINTNFVLPMLTHGNVYMPPSCRSSASESELMQRFLEANAYFGVSDAYLENNFYDIRPQAVLVRESNEYGTFLFCEKYKNAARGEEMAGSRLPKKIADNMLELYKKLKGQLGGIAKFSYMADYFFYGPAEKLMGNFSPEKYNNLELIYSNNSVNLYKITKN